jgi:hypothetical protein
MHKAASIIPPQPSRLSRGLAVGPLLLGPLGPFPYDGDWRRRIRASDGCIGVASPSQARRLSGVPFSQRFYRGAALCSFLSALTTLGLIYLPRWYSPVPDIDARMALTTNPAYLLRSWIYLVHPFLCVVAALAVAARCWARTAGAAALGVLGFSLWGAVEAGQQTFTLVALDRTWRAAWPTADAAARELIRGYVGLYDLVWGSLYLLLLLGFLPGNLSLAVATWQQGGLGRWVALAFSAAAGLTFLFLLPELGGPALLDGQDWVYPLIQPAGRSLIGVWLWKAAADVGTGSRLSAA